MHERTQTPSAWSPHSWQSLPVLQQPTYRDRGALEEVLGQLALLPPLVTSWEIEELKRQLAAAARGEMFLLQGGDCAESFSECTSPIITNKLKILLQMSLVLVHSSHRRVIRVGRFAGQYAKPRSSDVEQRDGLTLPSYRGDLVNDLRFEATAREPDPRRLLQGYQLSALTLNFIRGLVDGGFADLHHPEYWDLDFVQHSPRALDYQTMVRSIGESLRFMETLLDVEVGTVGRVDFFSSHEGLHLPYEQAQTREVPRREGWYNLSTHFPWIGLRTAQPDGAHIEFFRGIRNPIGVKVGATSSLDDVSRLLDVLHPDNEPGRLTLICRFGVDGVEKGLARLIRHVRASGKTVVWCCDPMHGNTRTTEHGFKTRRFDDILREVEASFAVHQAEGSQLGGVHFELTGDDVTECVGGARGLGEVDLHRAYRSQVDPRLNYEQALEMALLVGEKMAESSAGPRAGDRSPA